MRAFLSAMLIALCSLFFCGAGPAAEPRQDKLVEKVRKAIEDGVKFLRLQERGKGHWELDVDGKVMRPGGWTALALLALLNSGVPPSDPMIQRGLEYLRSVKPNQTYVVGLQTMVFAQAGQAVDRERIQQNVDWLVQARMPSGWSYSKMGGDRGNLGDNSNTQYALLGLHEGLLAGAKVDPETLMAVRDFYMQSQIADGGWAYRRGQPRSSMTMTSAGVCNLLISGMDLAIGKQVLRADGSAENCGIYEENRPVANALQWIGRHFSSFPDKLDREAISVFGSPFYCLYGLERTGRLTGQRYFGGRDWYRMGCEYLVSIQKPDGSWEGRGDHMQQLDHWPVVATSFSLLFLSKGRTPVLISKLAHGQGDGWNNKRSDVRHLVDFASQELFKKQPLAWQVFDIRQKQAEDDDSRRQLAEELLPSPIVYITGHHIRLSDKEVKVLREYVTNGGFILAEACCGDRELFDRDFRALVKEELFPDNSLRPVPPDHPVWTASGKFVVPPKDFPLWGIQQGCKWVLLYSPRPLAGYWECNQNERGPGQKAFQLGANIVAYATGMEAPPPRLTDLAIVAEETQQKVRRGYLEVGQLAHNGDWRPAPRAMRLLMDEVRKTGVDVVLSTAQLRLNDDAPVDGAVSDLADVKFLYLHGRRDFRASAKAMEKLRFNLENGGTLLADACCGSSSFDASFRQFIQQLWVKSKDDKDNRPAPQLQPIPLNDELYSKKLNGVAIEGVRCRRERADGKGITPEYQSVTPALEGIKMNDRWVVIYSRYDIGCALENHKSSDCLGHDHASAVQLARAAVLYALKR